MRILATKFIKRWENKMAIIGSISRYEDEDYNVVPELAVLASVTSRAVRLALLGKSEDVGRASRIAAKTLSDIMAFYRQFQAADGLRQYLEPSTIWSTAPGQGMALVSRVLPNPDSRDSFETLVDLSASVEMDPTTGDLIVGKRAEAEAYANALQQFANLCEHVVGDMTEEREQLAS
jgi:hypothetical protein